MKRPPVLHLGLRARVVALFALGALVLSVALALATYSVSRNNLLDERERSSIRAARLDARTVQAGLSAAGDDPTAVLKALATGSQRRPLLLVDGEPKSINADDGTLTDAVSTEMVSLVTGGEQAVQRVEVDGEAALVVGLPLEGFSATYYEVNSLTEVSDTLRSLAATLTLFAALTTVLGAALGYYASRRLFAPLGSIAAAARAIGEGDLSARLDPSDDRDLRAITSSFNTMVDQLASRLERDRRFAADVSHELRSPLQTLTAASSVLVRQKDTMDKRTGSAAVLVAEEVERFAALVQDLLELARDEAPVTLRDTELPLLLKEVGKGLVRRGGLDLDGAPAHWPLDAKRFERVLSNLLQNAKRHGGGAVRLGASVVDGHLVVEVDDAGPGVPLEERELIFDRFGRGRAASARGFADGTGLGLALVRQYVEAHHGVVSVMDRPGGGARFRVVLPRGVLS